jgi:hypothetical protein
MLSLGQGIAKAAKLPLQFIKDNLKLYLDFKSNKSDTLKFPSEGSTEFNGSSNYIETLDSSDFDFGTGDFSISFWFNVDDIDWNWAVSRVNSANSNDVFRAGINNSGKIIFRDIVGGVDVAGSTTISINTWYHFFAVRNSGTLKVYLNGSEDGSASSGGNLDSDKGFIIGRWQGNGDYWNGQLTNVAVWSRALEPEEIQSIMNKSYSQLKGVEKTSLVSWWALDDDTVNGAINSHVPEVLGNEIFPTSNSVYTTDGSHYTKDSSNPPNLTYQDTGTGTVTINNSDLEESINISATYKLTFTIFGLTSGQANLKAVSTNFGNTYVDETMLDNGTHTFYFIRPAGGGDGFKFRSDTASGSTFTISDYSLKRITSDSNIGHIRGLATTTTSVFGGNAPVLPRAVDVAKEGQADAIGNGSLTTSSGGYADLGNDSLIQFGGSFSVSCWFKTIDTTATNEMVIAKSDDGSSAGWLIRLNSSRKLDFTYTNSASGGVGVTISDTGSAVNDGEWYHVAFVHESGVGNRAYKNGILIGSNSTGTDLGSHTPNLHVGNQDFSTARALDGSFAQVGLWQGALTQAQIQSVMESTSYSKIPADVKSTLSENYVTNSTFDSDISGWSQTNSTSSNRTTSHATIDGRTCIDINDASTSGRFNAQFDLGSNAVDGELYKISYYARKAQTGSTSKDFIVGLGFTNVGGDAGNVDKTVAEYDTWEFQEIYIVCGSANNYLQFLPTAYDNTHIGRLFLDDVKVQKVTNDIVAYYPLDGSSSANGVTNDATTGEVLGSELIPDGEFTDESLWDAGSDTAIGTGISFVNGQAVWDTSGTIELKQDITINSGKLYKVVLDIDSVTSGTIRNNVGSYGGTFNTAGIKTEYITGTGSRFYLVGFTGFDGVLNSVSVKEVLSNTGVLK